MTSFHSISMMLSGYITTIKTLANVAANASVKGNFIVWNGNGTVNYFCSSCVIIIVVIVAAVVVIVVIVIAMVVVVCTKIDNTGLT